MGDRLMTYSVHLPSVFKYFVSVTFALEGCRQLENVRTGVNLSTGCI